jgi:hypothetical protein
MCSRGPLSCLTASWVARFPDDVDVPRLVPVRRDKTPVVRVPLAGIHPSGSRVILLAPTMAGDRVEFQGGRGTLIDECPSTFIGVPWHFPVSLCGAFPVISAHAKKPRLEGYSSGRGSFAGCSTAYVNLYHPVCLRTKSHLGNLMHWTTDLYD